MPDRAEIACQAGGGLRRFAQEVQSTQVLLGFDGFVDSIIKVVDKRQDTDSYTPIGTIEQFGQRILSAAGESANLELVTTLKKLGGNGPIMANALASAGFQVTYVGALGYPDINEVFREFADRAEVHSIGEPGMTDALEFTDGKLMLGKYEHLREISQERIGQVLGAASFTKFVRRSRLIGMVNWTMLPAMETIWTDLAENVLPHIGEEAGAGKRLIFIDLADPEKRNTEDLLSALRRCTRLNRHADVLLGLNLKESRQVVAALGLPEETDAEAAIESTARAIREKLDLHGVVIHPRRGAAAAILADRGVESASFAGPFVANPKLSTGAGDNFNAGFCLGRLAGLDVPCSLCVGTATSGYYVRNAASPTIEQLADFCDVLPSPEG